MREDSEHSGGANGSSRAQGNFSKDFLESLQETRVRLFTLSPGDTVTLGSGLRGPESGLLVKATLTGPCGVW